MAQSGAVRATLVVRPSFGLLLKRFVDSNDGRGLGMVVIFAAIGVVVLARSSVPAAVVAGGVLAYLVVGVARRLRYEVAASEIRVGNIVRTHVLPLASITGLGVETLNYESGGNRYRVLVGTNRVGRNGRPVVIPAIATERKRPEAVEQMIEESHRIFAAAVAVHDEPSGTPVVTHGEPAAAAAGWHADPLGRHEQRYWDGARWTAHVSDGGVLGVDPLSG